MTGRAIGKPAVRKRPRTISVSAETSSVPLARAGVQCAAPGGNPGHGPCTTTDQAPGAWPGGLCGVGLWAEATGKAQAGIAKAVHRLARAAAEGAELRGDLEQGSFARIVGAPVAEPGGLCAIGLPAEATGKAPAGIARVLPRLARAAVVGAVLRGDLEQGSFVLIDGAPVARPGGLCGVGLWAEATGKAPAGIARAVRRLARSAAEGAVLRGELEHGSFALIDGAPVAGAGGLCGVGLRAEATGKAPAGIAKGVRRLARSAAEGAEPRGNLEHVTFALIDGTPVARPGGLCAIGLRAEATGKAPAGIARAVRRLVRAAAEGAVQCFGGMPGEGLSR